MNKCLRETTCCFTGHRPYKLPWGNNDSDERCVELKMKLRDVIESVYTAGIRHFICGMAQGCDMMFCEEVISFRECKKDVTIEAAIPCETQCRNWPELTRNRYYRLVSQCDIETLLQTTYTPDCMLRRNRYMVDNSSVIIAVYDGNWGGTLQTIRYAKSQQLEIIALAP